MRHFKKMRGIVEELLLHNSYLTRKLEQCTGSVKETEILSAVNKLLQVSKRLETAVKKTEAAHVRGKGSNDQRKDRAISGKTTEECGNNPPRAKRK